VLAFEILARGTLNSASVYPREVVKSALRQQAAAVIFAHNHPSGIGEPSGADRTLTQRLREALNLIDIRVLDHFIIGEGPPVSFAERGLL
jgi:DNA repair protein RadC